MDGQDESAEDQGENRDKQLKSGESDVIVESVDQLQNEGRDDEAVEAPRAKLDAKIGNRAVEDLEQMLQHKKHSVASLRSEVEEFKNRLLSLSLGSRNSPQLHLLADNISPHKQSDGEGKGTVEPLGSFSSSSPDNEVTGPEFPGGKTPSQGSSIPSSGRPGEADPNSDEPMIANQRSNSSRIDYVKGNVVDYKKYEEMKEQLTLENSRLRERLSVAEAKSNSSSDCDTVQQHSQVVANLEREIATVQNRTDEQMEALRETTRREYEEKIKSKDLEIKSLQESLEKKTTVSFPYGDMGSRGWDGTQDMLNAHITFLERENGEKDKEIQSLSMQARESSEVMDSLKHEIGSQERTVQTLRSEMEALRTQLKDANEVLQQEQNGKKGLAGKGQAALEKENRYIIDRNISLGKEIDFLLKDLEYAKESQSKSKETVKRLEEEKEQLLLESRASIEMLQNELADISRSKATMESGLKNRVSSLEESHRVAVETIAKKEKRVADLEGRLQTAESDLSSSKSELVSNQRNFQQLEKEKKSIQEQNSSFAEEMSSLRKCLESSDTKLKDLESLSTRLGREKAKAERENQVAMMALKSELENAKTIKNELEMKLKQEIGSLQRSIQGTVETQEKSNSLIESLEKRLLNSQKECNTQADTISRYERDLRSTKKENNNLVDENASLHEKIVGLERSLDSFKSSLKESESVVARLEEENNEIKEEHRKAQKVIEKELEDAAKAKSVLELDFKDQKEAIETSHQMKISELETMLKNRTATIDTLEKVSTLHKETISALRGKTRQLTERMKGKVPNSQSERLSRALSKNISEANKSAQLLANEITQLVQRLSSIEEKGSRVCDLEILLKESETIFSQFEQEKSGGSDGKEKMFHHPVELSPEKTTKNELDRTKNFDEIEVQKDEQIKQLQEELSECKDTIAMQKKKLMSKEEARASQLAHSNPRASSDMKAKLEQDLLAIRKENEELQRKVYLLTKQLEGTIRTQRNLVKEEAENTKSLEKQLRDCQKTLAEQTGSLESSKQQLCAVQMQNKKLQQEIETKDKRISDQRKDLQTLISDLKQARGSNEALRKQVSLLRNRISGNF